LTLTLLPRQVAVAAAVFTGGALITYAYWALSGNSDLAVHYVRYGGAAFLVSAALVELMACRAVQRDFEPAEPMGAVWNLLALAAACRLIGHISRHLLSYHPDVIGMSPSDSPLLAFFGQDMSGPVTMAVQAISLWLAARVYGRLGLENRLQNVDWMLIGVVALYGFLELLKLPGWLGAEQGHNLQWYLGWSMYPLLATLLAQAVKMRRAVEPLRPGLFARTWLAYATGIVLTALGMCLNRLVAIDFIKWPWDAATWLVWYPAAAAYAVAPLYHLTAVRRLTLGAMENSGSWEIPPHSR
jgi:hypothetical protein